MRLVAEDVAAVKPTDYIQSPRQLDLPMSEVKDSFAAMDLFTRMTMSKPSGVSPQYLILLLVGSELLAAVLDAEELRGCRKP